MPVAGPLSTLTTIVATCHERLGMLSVLDAGLNRKELA